MSRYAADGAGPVAAAREFKQMVQQLHNAGIEVILDVVYNHTAEGKHLGLQHTSAYIFDLQHAVQLHRQHVFRLQSDLYACEHHELWQALVFTGHNVGGADHWLHLCTVQMRPK